MNPNVLVVQEDMTVEELARFLVESEISGAPVVDPEGRLVGVVSVTDLAAERANPDFFVSEWGGTLRAIRSRSCASARKRRCGCATS